MERSFSLRGVTRADLLRQGFGFSSASRTRDTDTTTRRAEEGRLANEDEHALETDMMIPVDPNNAERTRQLAQAIEQDMRLQRDLRNAGLL
jgi:hypothetical protein